YEADGVSKDPPPEGKAALQSAAEGTRRWKRGASHSPSLRYSHAVGDIDQEYRNCQQDSGVVRDEALQGAAIQFLPHHKRLAGREQNGVAPVKRPSYVPGFLREEFDGIRFERLGHFGPALFAAHECLFLCCLRCHPLRAATTLDLPVIRLTALLR